MEVGHTMQFYAHIFWLYIFHWNVKFTIVSNVDKDLWNKPFVGNCKWICEYKSASLCLKEGGHKKIFRGDFCSQIVCNFHKDAHLCSQIGWKRREFFKPFSCTFFANFHALQRKNKKWFKFMGGFSYFNLLYGKIWQLLCKFEIHIPKTKVL